MANRKISELTKVGSSSPTDELVLRRGSTNVSIESQDLLAGATVDTGSLVASSSIAGTTITFTKGDGTTYTNEIVSASYAISSSHEVVNEVSSSYAETASFAEDAISSSYAVTASYAVSSSLAQLALEAISSSYAISASHAEISDEAISASYALTASHATSTAGTLSNGTSVDAFSFNGSEDATVDISTYSASVSTDRTALSSSLTTTDQTISSSVAALSGSASDARNLLAADLDTISSSASTARDVLASQVSGAFAADSASFSTRVTTLEEFSSSLDVTYATDAELNAATASLSGSASDARNQLASDYIAADTTLSASLTTTDQTISASVATLSGSASDARNALGTDYIAADTALSSSLASDRVKKTGDTMTGALVIQNGASNETGLNVTANSGFEPTIGFLQEGVAQSTFFVTTGSPYALEFMDGPKSTYRNVRGADPIIAQDFTTKNYVDTLSGSASTARNQLATDYIAADTTLSSSLASDRVKKSGDTMTGLLTLSANPTGSNDAATKAYVDSLSVGTAWAGGYLSGQGAYADKYDLTQTFDSNNGDVTWSTANDEWALTESGTYLISTNGYWDDVNSKTIEIRYNTTAGQGSTSGTLAASQAADTTAKRWDFFTRLTTTGTVYLWVHNTGGFGIVRNWKIQIQRLY